MASPYTYEQMKARQRDLGPTGPDGPVMPDSPDDSEIDPDPGEADTTAVAVDDSAPAQPAAEGPPPAKGPMTFDEHRAKRAVVLNALRNSPHGVEEFARHIRSAYNVSKDFKATPDEILRAGFRIQSRTIPDLTPQEYLRAMTKLYGDKVDSALIQKGHEDYPGHEDEQSLIDEMYKRKIAKEETGPLTYADKAAIIARRYPELHKSDMEPEKALRTVYDAQKAEGKDVGSFDDWVHTQMAPTLAERGYGAAGGLLRALGEQVTSVGRLAHEASTPGQLAADVALATQAGDSEAGREAKERLKQAGMGAVNVGAIAAGGATKAGLTALEGVLGAAKTAPALMGAAEGLAAGGVQGGGQAAVEGQTPAEVAQAAALGAGIGGGIGAVAGGLHGRAEAQAAEKAAAKLAAEDEAAKAAATVDLSKKPVAAPAPAPETDPLALAAQHNAEVRWQQAVTDFAEKHGMDRADAAKLVESEKPDLSDLAAANTRYGVKASEVEELRQAMPEHMQTPLDKTIAEKIAAREAEAPPIPKRTQQGWWKGIKIGNRLFIGKGHHADIWDQLPKDLQEQADNILDEGRDPRVWYNPFNGDIIDADTEVEELYGTKLWGKYPLGHPGELTEIPVRSAETVGKEYNGVGNAEPYPGARSAFPAEKFVKPTISSLERSAEPVLTREDQVAVKANPEGVFPRKPEAPAEKGLVQSSISERMTSALNRAQAQLGERRALRRAELSARLAKAREAYGAVGGGLAGLKAKLTAMAGEIKKPDWAGVADEFKDVDLGAMHDAIARAPMLEGDKLTAHAGLTRLFNGTKMGAPTISQIRALRTAFGSQFVEAAVQNRTAMQKALGFGMKVLNTPRSLMTSLDLSAGMRQGYLMTSRPEYWRAWNTMRKAFGSESVEDAVVNEIKQNPKYDIMRQNGLFFQGEKMAGERSETFAGSLVDHWAGVRQSQRAYDTFINKLRADSFTSVYDQMASAGVDVSDPEFRQSLAHWINTSTGRGSMALLGRDAGLLNALAFSPRLAWSRFETFNPMYYKGLHPAVRVAAMKANVKTIGATMTLLGLMAGSGLAKVGWDPRNSDFAKLKFGNTRLDLLGGHQQLARLYAQLITGKVVSSTTGREVDLNGSDAKNGWARQGMTRLDVLSRFMEAKASPLASLAITLMRGKDFLGKPISIPNEVLTRFTPMPIQDVADAVRESGWGSGLIAAPAAVVGLGVQSYGPSLPAGAGGQKEPEYGVGMQAVNMGQRLWNHLNGIANDRELRFVTPQLADQWVKDAAMAQVVGQQEASREKGFYDRGFDQQSAIRKATSRRMSRVNKLYKDLAGANGEKARIAAEKDSLARRAAATGIDPDALRNPNVYSEITK